MVRLLLGTILVFFSLEILAQYDFNTRCIKAYNAATNLEFDRGKGLLEEELKDNPDNLVPILIANYIDFLQVVIGEQEDDFKQLKSNKSKRIRILEKASGNSPYYRYSLASINLQWALARSKFNDYTRAAFETRKAYFLLQANQEQYPDFTPNMIGLGVMHTLVGTIPEQYQWIINIFGLHGSVIQGLEELDTTTILIKTGEYSYLMPECLFFITFLSMNFQSDISLSDDYLELLEEYSNEHILLNYAYARYLMKSGHNDQAIDILSNRKKISGQYPFYYLDYLLGKAKLNRLDPEADKPFYTYVVNHKGGNYIKASYQKLAWYNLVNGNEKGYIENMGKVLQYGQAVIDADKQAMMEAETMDVPNVDLLKSRLLFDGGYYADAEKMLLGHNIILNNRKDSVEFTYRLGRINHAWKKIEKAKTYYQECIIKGSDLPNYFAANAALHLGMIYEEQGDYIMAREYYKMCMKMDFTEYKDSITQKAKAGLNRLKGD